MFGLFNKNKNKTQKQQVRPGEEKVNLLNNQEESQVSVGGHSQQLLAEIEQLEKELSVLKLAISKGSTAEVNPESLALVKKRLSVVKEKSGVVKKSEQENIVEGVFDGEKMIGADGEQYDVPANYASKSKLVEGDILKLTINNLGAFIYKQIKPIERERKSGVLYQEPQSLQYYAVADNKKWRLLTASVTYYKGETGDQIIFLIPKEAGSRWAAVENIVKS